MRDKIDMRLAGLILAGGRSRRMGRAKESLPIGDTTMLGWQCRTLLACTEPVIVVGRDHSQPLPDLPDGVDITVDALPGEGPLAAIAAGLNHLQKRYGFTAADAAMATGCDQPFLTPETVHWLRARLGDADLVMPRAYGKLQPLTAIYRVRAGAVAEQLLQRGVRRPRELADHLPCGIVEEDELRRHDPSLRFLRNLNHSTDYEAARRLLE